MPVKNRLAELLPEIVEWRRDLHANPEIRFDTHRTAALVADRLRAFGCDEVTTGIGQTGVVGVIRGKQNSSGRVVGLRADMDALPIEEETGKPYASKVQGKYWDFHVALMKERRVTKDNVMQIAAKVGLDVEALKAEMEKPKYAAAIKQTQQIATALGIEGTPGFIVDGKVNPGYLPSDRLQALVAEVREKGCQFC